MIRIQVTACAGQAIDTLTADFDELGGTIGRADHGTLTLIDEKRHISRTQALVSFRAGGYFLCDNGSAVPTIVNGTPVGKGNEVAIRGGDEIQIGDYTLIVHLVSAHEPPARPAADAVPRHVVHAPRRPAVSSAVQVDPFADPFATPQEHVSAARSSVIPQDYDPLAETIGFADSAEEFGADDMPIITEPPRNVDDIYQLRQPTSWDPLAPHDPLRAAEGFAHEVTVDSLAGIALSSKRAAKAAPQRDDAPILSATFPVPGREPVSAKVKPPPNRCVESRSHADELVRAFAAGAGMQEGHLPPNLTPEMMNLMGQLLREAVGGTLELLLARALTKQEVRAPVTVIVARENNPLKFSPTPEAAMTNLLSPSVQGFMPAVAAMRDAYNDLRSHQFGVMAGMRAALVGVLERFDPAHLERMLTQKSSIDALIPSGRKAKLWQTYEHFYAEILREAEDDFEALFGKAFLKAYEAQVRKLEHEEKRKQQ